MILLTLALTAPKNLESTLGGGGAVSEVLTVFYIHVANDVVSFGHSKLR